MELIAIATIITFFISVTSLGIASRETGLRKQLEEANKDKEEAVTTLTNVLDGNGEVRGQLALPGEVVEQATAPELVEARKRLADQLTELEKARKELAESDEQRLAELQTVRAAFKTDREAFEAAAAEERRQLLADSRAAVQALEERLAQAERARQEAEVNALEGVDSEGNVLVRLRLPGELRIPNTTPCGELCRYAETKDGQWRCTASRRRFVDEARQEFLDARDQCSMFTYSSTEHAKAGQVRDLIRGLEQRATA